jgi:hypothetical protein
MRTGRTAPAGRHLGPSALPGQAIPLVSRIDHIPAICHFLLYRIGAGTPGRDHSFLLYDPVMHCMLLPGSRRRKRNRIMMQLQQYDSPRREILTVLAYFDYFRFPLLPGEIILYCTVKLEPEALAHCLSELVTANTIATEKGYYGFDPISDAVHNREEGAERFRQLQLRIARSSARIRMFPFVQLIGLSGSLSKGYAGVCADIDFFIVTAPDRLWICRTLLHAFKKLAFLKGAQHWYCMNYFIDETALLLEEQNYYTAIELVTLKPLFHIGQCHERLLAANRHWIRQQLPNWDMPLPTAGDKPVQNFFTALAAFFSNSRLNHWLMRFTDRKWRNKWRNKHYPEADYELAFKTRINISKNHYHNYQKKMLKYLEEMNREEQVR